MKKMFVMIAAVMSMVAVTAFADTVGVQYSGVRSAGDTVRSNTAEINGSHDINASTAVVARGQLSYDHATAGNSTQVAAGVKVKLGDAKAAIVPWVQPLATYTSPNGDSGYTGYELGAGVDVKMGSITVTPGYTYANNFGVRTVRMQTVGVGVNYALNKDYVVGVKARREINEVGNDGTRFYVGVARSF